MITLSQEIVDYVRFVLIRFDKLMFTMHEKTTSRLYDPNMGSVFIDLLNYLKSFLGKVNDWFVVYSCKSKKSFDSCVRKKGDLIG